MVSPFAHTPRALSLLRSCKSFCAVKKFIIRLHQTLSSGNVNEVAHLYERGWNSLSNEFYKAEEWPRAEVVASLVRNDEVFLTFYRELYFRHLYSRFAQNLDIDDRFDSYENYCNLFNYVLNSEGPVSIDLPSQWLSDIIDEFIWQFGTFSAWRSKTKDKSEDEIMLLEESPQVWSCYSVLNVLYSLVQKSQIQTILRAARNPEDTEAQEVANSDYSQKNLYRSLGYFSILGLLRVHVLLGDYTLALKMLDDLGDLKSMVNPQTRFHSVHSAHVAVFYYVGFSYLMMRRWADAVDVLSRGISHFYKNRRFTYGADQVSKSVDRMIALVAIAQSLAPSTRLEDWVKQGIQDKYAEAANKMNRGASSSSKSTSTSDASFTKAEVLETYEDVFMRSCPKFISPSPPVLSVANQDTGEAAHHPQIIDPTRHQLSLFLADVESLLGVQDMKSFLKLYTNLGIGKLAQLLGKDEETVVQELSIVKGAARGLRWNQITKPSLLEGELELSGDVGFVVDVNTVTITESKKSRQVADYFLRRSIKAKEQVDFLRSRPLPTAATTQNRPAQNQNYQQNRPQQQANSGEKKVAWVTASA